MGLKTFFALAKHGKFQTINICVPAIWSKIAGVCASTSILFLEGQTRYPLYPDKFSCSCISTAREWVSTCFGGVGHWTILRVWMQYNVNAFTFVGDIFCANKCYIQNKWISFFQGKLWLLCCLGAQKGKKILQPVTNQIPNIEYRRI